MRLSTRCIATSMWKDARLPHEMRYCPAPANPAPLPAPAGALDSAMVARLALIGCLAAGLSSAALAQPTTFALPADAELPALAAVAVDDVPPRVDGDFDLAA